MCTCDVVCICVDFQSHSDFKAFENLADDVRLEKCQLPMDLLRFVVQSGFDVVRCVRRGVESAVLCSWVGWGLLFLFIPVSTPGTDLRPGLKVTLFHLKEALGSLLRSSPKCCPSWPHRQMVRLPTTPQPSPLTNSHLTSHPPPSPLTKSHLTLHPHLSSVTPHSHPHPHHVVYLLPHSHPLRVSSLQDEDGCQCRPTCTDPVPLNKCHPLPFGQLR